MYMKRNIDMDNYMGGRGGGQGGAGGRNCWTNSLASGISSYMGTETERKAVMIIITAPRSIYLF